MALALILAGAIAVAEAQEGPPGVTVPLVLPPFDPNARRCTPPPGLQRVLGFAQDNERQFIQGVGYGLAMAAKNRGLAFRVALAADDPARMIAQAGAFLEERVGAVVAAPVDPPSFALHLQRLIWSGAFVGTVVPPPAITLLNAPQYLTGKVLADAAAEYIRGRLNGKAKVVLLTHDSLQFLAPRFAAIRDALRDIPGVTIVADISPVTVNKAGGEATMATILLAQPNIDVVLGADTVVLGALAALRAAGKARDDQFLGGIDGEPEAVTEIRKNGPYKASISLASPVFGYALGELAADWLEGKSVPQTMDILPKALTTQNVASYEADLADPAAVYADTARRASYLKMYGNICYETRDRYVNFPWSSEVR
jgi:ribose transport system substrate-binding protein